jgi:hypothetical protein
MHRVTRWCQVLGVWGTGMGTVAGVILSLHHVRRKGLVFGLGPMSGSHVRVPSVLV